jgi:hypothetical protein
MGPAGMTAREERLLPVTAVALILTLVASLTALTVGHRTLASSEAPASPAPAPVEVTVTTPPNAEVEVAAEPEAAPTPPEPPPPDPGPPPEPEPEAEADPPPPADGDAPAARPEPTPSPAADPASPPDEGPVAAVQAGGGPSPSERVFAGEFPNHAAARQRDGDPASFHWAVLVGVNEYRGRTANTLGSVADVTVLREALLRSGWRNDHILVLTDGHATHDRIVRALEWLARTTDDRSRVVVSFSGHMQHRGGASALWPTDNRFIWNEQLGHLLGAIEPDEMWVSLQGCHAEGMRAPGVEGDGRIITYSSKVHEKSYEDPEAGHSVQGNYLFREALRDGHGDLDGDGRVSVQEAYNWATPRAHQRTSGRQTPVVADGLERPFHLEVADENVAAAYR